MIRGSRLRHRTFAAVSAAALLVAGCAQPIDGTPSITTAPNAQLKVIGGSSDAFDTTVKNALSDVTAFWKTRYPKVSNGKSLPPIKGGFFSVDGREVVKSGHIDGPAAKNECLQDSPTDIVDNAFFCRLDDSIAWDRAPNHLIGAIANSAGEDGNLLIAMAFAHEFGHALQYRLGVFDRDLPTIATESQADCAAGAWVASVLDNQAAHFQADTASLDAALNAYLLVRDKTPTTSERISHGNGFDRLAAVNDGIQRGVTFCFDNNYFDRQYTERPFVDDQDYLRGGNETLAEVLNANDPRTDNTAGGLQPDLNRFWTQAAKSINKQFTAVKIAKADHPKCGASADSEFGYCPDDNTVYYSMGFATKAYNSLDVVDVNSDTAEVTILKDQPADFALGTLFAVGWGLAVRHQLFQRSLDDKAALLSAVCYTGAYSKNINIEQATATQTFILSPPDMDEATSAMMSLVGLDKAFGTRGSTGLERIQAFVKGYNGGLSVC